MYDDFNDSISIQLAVLEAVANQKSELGAKTFIKLLSKKLIVSTNDNDIEELFNSFEDSLEIGAKLFPDILKFSRYQEYRLPIYQLLSKLLEKGKVRPHIYSRWKNEIIRDAQYDMTCCFHPMKTISVQGIIMITGAIIIMILMITTMAIMTMIRPAK